MGSLSVAASDGGVDQQYWRDPPPSPPSLPSHISAQRACPLPLLGCTENFNIPFHSLNAASRYLRPVQVFSSEDVEFFALLLPANMNHWTL